MGRGAGEARMACFGGLGMAKGLRWERFFVALEWKGSGGGGRRGGAGMRCFGNGYLEFWS